LTFRKTNAGYIVATKKYTEIISERIFQGKLYPEVVKTITDPSGAKKTILQHLIVSLDKSGLQTRI